MITDPARYVFDAIEHMLTIKNRGDQMIYLDTLIANVNELEDVEIACRIIYNFFIIFDVSSIESHHHCSNFGKFCKKHGQYIVESNLDDEKPTYKKLYTYEDILNT
jgi:hypothetical protein